MNPGLRLLACVSGVLLCVAASGAEPAPATRQVALPGGGTCEYGAPELPSNIKTLRGFRSATVTGRIDIVPNAPPIAAVIEHSSGFPELDEAVLVTLRKIRCQSPLQKPRLISAFQSFVFNVDDGYAIPTGPETARLFAGYGLFLAGNGLIAQADAAYADAIRMNPQYAATYSYRADLRERNGQLAEALADLDEAIKINPRYAWALRQRSTLRTKMGDASGAEADRSVAAMLLPRAHERWPLGQILFNRGEYRAASDALRLAVREEPEPAYTYAVIWLYLASMRDGDAAHASRELEINSKDLDAKAWPFAIVNYLLTRATGDELLAAARGADDPDRAGRMCEANYYMAQKELIDGREPAARQLLENARRDCPKGFIEYTAAVAQLGRISSTK